MRAPDTIAAVSTPPGAAGIGIVRLSGAEAARIAGAVFRAASGRPPEPRVLTLGWVVDEAGARVDQAMAVFLPAPKTYTREDVLELHCHGGHVVLSRVLQLVLDRGARTAEAGEFTRRAFENGRIDLAQAEAVIDVIHAAGEAGLALSEEILAGGLSARIEALTDAVASVCAEAEAYIDFPEDDLGSFPAAGAVSRLVETKRRCRELAGTYDEGRLLSQGLRTVIAGRPNVGKSSLLNRLLGWERAIVAELPGTTRDTLEELVTIDGVPFHLADVAGLRETTDPVEVEGVRRARAAVSRADLVLLVVDASRPPDAEDDRVAEMAAAARRVLPVANKIDIAEEADLSAWRGRFDDEPLTQISALTGEGLDDLRGRMRSLAVSGELPGAGEVVVTRLRHRRALEAAAAALSRAAEEIAGGVPLDLAVIHLREALDQLGEIVGRVTTEDLLDRIFAEFCIGK